MRSCVCTSLAMRAGYHIAGSPIHFQQLAIDRAILWRARAAALAAILGVVDDIDEIVVRGVERLHLGRAIILLVARGDAFLIGSQRLDNLGDGGVIAGADGAAID